ncbi:hypothetical protein FH608_046300 [Nonomuraea phyllanthi]|uniref:Uncharacterized protein n=1 Tax=Nonomuraea phyllanthi TaxID=2219224 RepID=A0A5C4V6D5_9ACTN|nr:hypothetical protein [Nonomuraea phyllanthi]KAB8186907.1 hypothetical protein FH608_046300 [Nonomuraea phyllanthi]
MPETPITCEWCRNSPATQAFVFYFKRIQRKTSLVCEPCGDRGEQDVARNDPVVWRYRLTPIKEVQSA